MNQNTRLFRYIFQFFFCKMFCVSSAECSYLALEETAGLFTHIPGVALFVPPPCAARFKRLPWVPVGAEQLWGGKKKRKKHQTFPAFLCLKQCAIRYMMKTNRKWIIRCFRRDHPFTRHNESLTTRARWHVRSYTSALLKHQRSTQFCQLFLHFKLFFCFSSLWADVRLAGAGVT